MRSKRPMKKIIVSLDDEAYRRARSIAARLQTSVSALARKLLTDLGTGEQVERLKARERELRGQITDFRASDRLSRDEVHNRGA
ncbi:MAG: hypothetical protein ACREET_02870 [Stellaceae bacterium]